MPVDNSIYDTHASAWWAQDNFLHMLKTGLNPARFEYFRHILALHALHPASLKVLDIGAGGGFLSEEFARLGCSVNGLDLSFASVKTASQHARSAQLSPNYLAGSAAALPFSESSFDLVLCCDVLEHLTDLQIAIAEAARVLKSGGLYLFDTINRSPRSYLETILIAQQLPLTRFFTPGTHAWRQFITPSELSASLNKHQLKLLELRGLQPGISPLQTALQIFRLKLGQINYAEFGRRLKFQTGPSLHNSYIGYALKR